MDVDFDLCGGIYPKGARHNGLLCEPDGRAVSCPARALCITPLCWMPPHTNNRRSRQRLCRNIERARYVQATYAPAACERRALDGVAAFGEAMKRDGVKRLRQRSGHTWNGAKAEGSFIAFCALSDTAAASDSPAVFYWVEDAGKTALIEKVW